jgi:hypothetical protein
MYLLNILILSVVVLRYAIYLIVYLRVLIFSVYFTGNMLERVI